MKQLSLIQQCVMEAIRLHAPGMIIRKTTKPLRVKNYLIPANQDVCISPFLTGQNTQIFTNPGLFLSF